MLGIAVFRKETNTAFGVRYAKICDVVSVSFECWRCKKTVLLNRSRWRHDYLQAGTWATCFCCAPERAVLCEGALLAPTGLQYVERRCCHAIARVLPHLLKTKWIWWLTLKTYCLTGSVLQSCISVLYFRWLLYVTCLCMFDVECFWTFSI